MKKVLKGKEVINLINEVKSESVNSNVCEVNLDEFLKSDISESEILGDVISNSEKVLIREKAEKVKKYHEKTIEIHNRLKSYDDSIF